MDNATIIALVTALSQFGVAVAAYRLGSKVATRQDAHEKEDRLFHNQVRDALNIPRAA